jgi:Rrf2 family transcriptional regulator, nitric oxide-sensitive transcriptional repressor
MLTQTSESALKALIYLVHYGGPEPVPPREIAEQIGASPSYMAKITRMLVKTNILRSHRGSLGGVSLSRSPESISLLDVVEACQGLLVGNYCEGISDHPAPVCAFHQAMVEVHEATISVLSKWTLAKLAQAPAPGDGRTPNTSCKINIALPQKNGALAR